MNSSFVSIRVNSTEPFVRFYEALLDFHVERELQPGNGIGIVFMNNADNFTLEFVAHPEHPAAGNERGAVSLMFMNNDLEKKKKILEDHNVEYVEDRLPNGMRFLRFQDPGNLDIVLYE